MNLNKNFFPISGSPVLFHFLLHLEQIAGINPRKANSIYKAEKFLMYKNKNWELYFQELFSADPNKLDKIYLDLNNFPDLKAPINWNLIYFHHRYFTYVRWKTRKFLTKHFNVKFNKYNIRINGFIFKEEPLITAFLFMYNKSNSSILELFDSEEDLFFYKIKDLTGVDFELIKLKAA